ncbi:MAG: UDP-N-acetylmuramoyl-L-alanine--D-glutamate ligase [Candidatus Margulisiibacteriota bacterium]|nr:MAG: UDP-N-acetylmuramoylalanine--D-glutamate ligase [Candidatus Margulisbacteria bacterium GWD2_39_127]OGI02959.1 MAG: UDP-N-acetylmuramoylalanine--D-glutamate ligase [Candidatus Margulisbacteria bacterium GWF2_38_17]OGI09448.1 MAG: UDP-N-acetylmuramoylalanine--D-glutamate ligase [Candidatus Margulisbacteria bacterium GWE2_39_32]PZM78752.1 MAG: UDP-N-acetylmuramoyl-L-alanine--D-glutamate ligase [Candidatus Margulisiibacteriota bacterium]HAR63346.1 UDP-N-acetylmuramoyl-L-alanine--D-glutamate
MNIAVLGEGLTGNAIKQKISILPDHIITSVDEADVIIASPGIPPEQFPKTEKPIISEIELAYRLFQDYQKKPRFIGITGTNGKTTITTLIGDMLDCPVAGNIGKPLISFIPENKEQEAAIPDYIAVELSSYQLETTISFRPDVSIITNITEDHLTRHKTMQNYAKAKAKIFESQTPTDLFIYNELDPLILEMLPTCQAQKKGFDVNHDYLRIKEHLNIPGDHNLENAMAAVYCSQFFGLAVETIFSKLEKFTGVEHRIEYVATINNIDCYNDSKGTNPESTITALKALHGQGILILGGKDKCTSLDQLCKCVKEHASKTILIGEAKERFCNALTAHGYTSIYMETDLSSAVKKGLELATDEKYLLLSPACASFDMYNNFEERGTHFKLLIKKYFK